MTGTYSEKIRRNPMYWGNKTVRHSASAASSTAQVRERLSGEEVKNSWLRSFSSDDNSQNRNRKEKKRTKAEKNKPRLARNLTAGLHWQHTGGVICLLAQCQVLVIRNLALYTHSELNKIKMWYTVLKRNGEGNSPKNRNDIKSPRPPNSVPWKRAWYFIPRAAAVLLNWI